MLLNKKEILMWVLSFCLIGSYLVWKTPILILGIFIFLAISISISLSSHFQINQKKSFKYVVISFLLLISIFLFLTNENTFFSLIPIFLIFGFLRLMEDDNESGLNFDSNTSFPNPYGIIRGYKWSDFKDIKKKLSKKNENDVFIDITKKDEEIGNYKQENAYLKASDFKKTILTIGSMGSGKTEFFNSILKQNQDSNFGKFKREIIHDIKGDFTQNFYNPETDFIFNPYDERGLNWDIWEDMKINETSIMSFVQNLIEAGIKEKDFFATSASEKITKFFITTFYENENATSAEKWESFEQKVEDFKSSIQDDKTQSSILATMELALEQFKFLAFIEKTNTKDSFSINQFINGTGRLILLNNASYSKKLNPLFTGFLSMLFENLLSQADRVDDDLTLILLDEFLSLKFEEDIRTKLITQIRSKGGCLVFGIQFLRMKDIDEKQLLDSSKFAMFIFNTSDNETVKHICGSFGETEYLKNKTSSSDSFAKTKTTSVSYSLEEKKDSFLTPEKVQSMPPFHHLSMFTSSKIFYLGYTPLVDLVCKNEAFEKRDLADYYKSQYLTVETKVSKEVVEVPKENDIAIDSDNLQYSISKTKKAIFDYSFEQKCQIWEELQSFEKDEEFNNIVSKYDLENVSLAKLLDGINNRTNIEIKNLDNELAKLDDELNSLKEE